MKAEKGLRMRKLEATKKTSRRERISYISTSWIEEKE